MNKFNLISIDTGASKKVEDIAQELFKSKYEFDIIQCNKKRNLSTGKIEKLEVLTNNLNNQTNIIIDDICDMAGSFIYCVKELQKIEGYKNSILIVSHMLHDTPNPELLSLFDGIYCTNSRHNKYYEKQGDHLVESKKIHVLNIF